MWSERAKECKINLDLLKGKYELLEQRREILGKLIAPEVTGGLAFNSASLEINQQTPLQVNTTKMDYMNTTLELNSLGRTIAQQEDQLNEYNRRASDQERELNEALPIIDKNLAGLEKSATEFQNDSDTPLNVRTEIKRLFESKKLLIQKDMFHGRQKKAYYDAMVHSVNHAKNHRTALMTSMASGKE